MGPEDDRSVRVSTSSDLDLPNLLIGFLPGASSLEISVSTSSMSSLKKKGFPHLNRFQVVSPEG